MRQRNFLIPETGADIGASLGTATLREAPASPPSTAPRDTGLASGWNRVAVRALRTGRRGTLSAARILALLHTCMYNAWAAYDDHARQTTHGVAVRLPRAERDAASKAVAMSHAAHLALAQALPARRAAFDAHLASLGLDLTMLPAPLTPAGIGHSQAAAMLGSWHGEDARVPTFAARIAEPAPGRPRPRVAASLACGWCRVADELAQREGYGDDQAVRLLFALANALADAELAGAGDRHGCSAAAAEVLRRFTGSERVGSAGMAPEGKSALGREIGSLVYEKANRYWSGRL